MRKYAIVTGIWAINTLGLVLAIVGANVQSVPMILLGSVFIGLVGVGAGFMVAESGK